MNRPRVRQAFLAALICLGPLLPARAVGDPDPQAVPAQPAHLELQPTTLAQPTRRLPPPSARDTAPRLGEANPNATTSVIYSAPPKRSDNSESWFYAAGFVCLAAAFYFTTRSRRASEAAANEKREPRSKDIV